ncbi:MAG: fructose-6-phosphate aldolase [Pseudomonadota bacterium]
MKFFIDSADLSEIKRLHQLGFVDGVTTNPSLIARSGRDFFEVISELCTMVKGPVSAEVVAQDHEGMLKEGHKLAKIADQIAVKLPLTPAGLQTCKVLSSEGIKVNVTLCFQPAQALLAAKAGASFISPFVGRLDDLGEDGMQLIESIRTIYDQYDFATEILVASVRGPAHVIQAAEIGADIVTIPPKVVDQLFKHPLTDSGLAIFLRDWKQTGQTIL